MPDLQPNLSIYPKAPAPMGIGDILSLVQRSGDIGTQRAMSDALSQNTGPDGTPDLAAAYKQWAADPRATMKTPGQAQAFTSAQGSQFDLKTSQMTTAGGIISSALTSPHPAAAIPHVVAMARSLGIPGNLIEPLIPIDPKDDETAKTALTALHNWVSNNGALPSVEVTDQKTGQKWNVPAGAAKYGTFSGGASGTPAPSAPGATPPPNATSGPGAAPFAGVPGAYPSGMPTGGGASYQAAADDSNKIIQAGPQRANQMAMLKYLDTLSPSALSGPTAPLEKTINQLWQRAFPGGKLTITADQLKNSEEYAKVAETMVGNMANAGHATDAFLHNAYGSNPSLELSQLGRSGITHWLMGNVDAEGMIGSQWQSWLKAHPGMDGQYYNWLYDKNGMNINEFDPRVFQYMRMNQDERSKFRGMMSPAEQQKFASNFEQYRSKGWLGATQ